MGVGRQVNWKGQWRVDVPHLRAIESGVAYDFDVLAGAIMAGKSPYVINGFVPVYTPGTDATTLQLVVAGSTAMNYAASESGTILKVPDNRAVETLTVANARVVGGFTAGQSNYIGLDYARTADSSTVDIVQFLDATTVTETAKSVPLARTLDYRIHISTSPFINTPQLAPVCIVVTDANNKIVSVADARSLMFRLAAGGDSPNPLGTYSWPQGRGIGISSAAEIAAFTGGDKAIGDMKTWMSAVMTSIWEIRGGERWFSDTTDRNLQFIRTLPGTLADNFVWDGASLKWEGLGVLMSGSTGVTNEIVNNLAGTALADGYCFYVDLDRTQDCLRSGTPLAVATAEIGDLGTPTMPGSRYVIAWRQGTKVYARGQYWDVSRPIFTLPEATTTTLGGVIVPTSGNLTVDGSGNIGVPVAAAGTLGVVRVGSGLSIDGSGILSATYSYTLPIASGATLGGIKIGTGLTIDGDGVVDVSFPPAGGVTDITTPDGSNYVGSVTLTRTNMEHVRNWGQLRDGVGGAATNDCSEASAHDIQIAWTGVAPRNSGVAERLQWLVDGDEGGYLAYTDSGASPNIDLLAPQAYTNGIHQEIPVSIATLLANADPPVLDLKNLYQDAKSTYDYSLGSPVTYQGNGHLWRIVHWSLDGKNAAGADQDVWVRCHTEYSTDGGTIWTLLETQTYTFWHRDSGVGSYHWNHNGSFLIGTLLHGSGPGTLYRSFVQTWWFCAAEISYTEVTVI